MAFVIVSFWWDVVICLVILFGLFYVYSKKKHNYWREKGLHGPEPTFLIGNMEGILSGKKSLGDRIQEIYNETKHHPYVGIYLMLRPTLLVNDVEQIKNIMVKNFDHFTDHFIEFNEKYDPLSAHLFNLRGDRWKNLRAKVTPTFTISKMKMMFNAVNWCADGMMNFLECNFIDGCVFEVKEIMAMFTTDVIGTCAFGIDCDSFNNPNSKFRKMGDRGIKLPLHITILQSLGLFIPKLLTKVPVSTFGSEVTNFFCELVKNTIDYRKKNNVKCNDFLQLLIQMKDEESSNPDDDGEKWTLMSLTSQALGFFLGGFETSSTTSSFALYELALNPDIQQRLFEEINEIMEKNSERLTYDCVGEMTYLTMVIEETLRKYPLLPALFRICTKDFVLPGTDIKIEKDTAVFIPMCGVQKDAEFFPNPEKFDPERFSPENRTSFPRYAYFPFGEGPRICIGSRFGMMQVKLGLIRFLYKYEVSVCEETPIPMVYDNKAFILTSSSGIYLKIKQR